MKYTAQIVKGQARGRKIGFPTLNLKIPPKLTLKQGVYTCWVWINGIKYAGALHFGPIPTFNQSLASLEIHVLNFMETHPPKKIIFKPVKFIRPIKPFSSRAMLKKQIKQDLSFARKLLQSKTSLLAI